MLSADSTFVMAGPVPAIHVVLAEDSVLLRDGLVRLLTAGGFQVVAAVDNAEALLAELAAGDYAPAIKQAAVSRLFETQLARNKGNIEMPL